MDMEMDMDMGMDMDWLDTLAMTISAREKEGRSGELLHLQFAKKLLFVS